MKKKKKSWIVWLVVAVLVVGVAGATLSRSNGKSTQNAPVETYTIARGDVSVTITGSGRLETADTLDIELPVGVEVEKVFVEAGDMAHEGDTLAILSTCSLETRAAELSGELTALDMQISARKTTGEIKAPAKGRVKYLPAGEGDEVIAAVNQHGSLAILSTDGLMQIDVQTDDQLSVGAQVRVKWNGGSEEGTVASSIDGGYRITLSDEDAPYQEQADVYSGSAKIGSGTLEIHAPLAIFGNGGLIEKVHVQLDDTVSLNGRLFTLSNEPATDSYRKAIADRADKAEQFQIVLKYLEDPRVLAPQDGVVQNIALSEGKKTASADGSGEMTGFTLGIGGAVKMKINVDELDVGKVEAGLHADVTLDAFTGESFSAKVVRVSNIGQVSGSIATYETELLLENDDRMLSGMNGSAVILSDMAENVLIVPLAAVWEDTQGAYVQKIGTDGTQIKTYIETGLSDGTYAQVVSGLSEGDSVVCQTTVSGLQAMQEMMLQRQQAIFGGEG